MRYLLPLLLLTRILAAAITPICSLSEVPCIEEGALVVFDVDDTLIRYPSHLGSECWFIEASSAPDFQKNAALLAKKLPVVPVEPCLASYISSLQKRGIAVMAITSRSLDHGELSDWPQTTVDQIHSIGVHFTTAPEIASPPTGTLYLDGVLIVGSRNKGKVLTEFLSEWEKKPTTIVFFDDRLSDLKKVEATNLPTELYWYRVIEPSRATYDSKAAATQLELLRGSR